MAELVDAADSKSVFERSGSSSLPRGTNRMFSHVLTWQKTNKKARQVRAFLFLNVLTRFHIALLVVYARLYAPKKPELWHTRL